MSNHVMGTWLGHVVPGSLLYVYGLLFYIHTLNLEQEYSSANTTHKEKGSTQQRYRKKTLDNDLDHENNNNHHYSNNSSVATSISSSTTTPSFLTRLLHSGRLQHLAYLSALVLSVCAAMVEYSRWSGELLDSSNLQHMTMYSMVMICASVGMLMQTVYISAASRVVVGISFLLSGLMFANHIHGTGEPDVYEFTLHNILSMLMMNAGVAYILWTMLAIALPPPHVLSAANHSPEQVSFISLLPVMLSVLSRVTVLLMQVSGTWFLHIAFSLYTPIESNSISHSPHEAHTLNMQLCWHCLAVICSMIVMEIIVHWIYQQWPSQSAIDLIHSNSHILNTHKGHTLIPNQDDDEEDQGQVIIHSSRRHHYDQDNPVMKKESLITAPGSDYPNGSYVSSASLPVVHVSPERKKIMIQMTDVASKV